MFLRIVYFCLMRCDVRHVCPLFFIARCPSFGVVLKRIHTKLRLYPTPPEARLCMGRDIDRCSKTTGENIMKTHDQSYTHAGLAFPAGRALLATLALSSTAMAGYANPTGGVVAAGSAAIVNTTASQMDITQSTSKAIINWGTFNIAPFQTTNFHQPSAGSATLNRIGDVNPSQILGKLNANGQLMLVNKNGFFFGPKADVKVGSLVATTADIDNSKFLSGNYAFAHAGDPNAQVVNNGKIKANDGGYVALVGPIAENKGTITANKGKVALGGGDVFTLDLTGDNLLSMALPVGVVRTGLAGMHAEADNSGKIYANGGGGKVQMLAKSSRPMLDSVINMDGDIEAKSAAYKKGSIVLEGDNVDVAGDMDVSGVGSADGGHIKAYARQNMSFSGTAKAEGGMTHGDGGDIAFTGDKNITLGGEASTKAYHSHAGVVSFMGGNTFNENAAEAYSIDYSLDHGGLVKVGAKKTINVNYDMNDDAMHMYAPHPANELRYVDRDANGNLTVNLNTKIHHEPNGKLTGEATKVNVSNKASIQQGVDVASDVGAKIDVAPGTYNENVNVYKNNIYLDPPAMMSKPKINGYVNITGDDVTLDGFHIEGGTLHGKHVGVNVEHASGAKVLNNHIDGGGSNGTAVKLYDAADATVAGNDIHEAETGVGADDAYRLVIKDNDIHAQNGVEIKNSTKTKVLDNKVVREGALWGGDGIELKDSDNAEVGNNTVSGYSIGIDVDSSANANIHHNKALNVTTGIDALDSNNLKLDHNTLVGRGPGIGTGVQIINSTNGKVTNNTANNFLNKLKLVGSVLTVKTGNNF